MDGEARPAPRGVSIVVPAHNEEAGVGATLAEIREALAGWERDVEIVVVDDGSTDRTAEIARQTADRVLSHPVCCGYGAALKTGIQAAQHDDLVIIDADGTYPASAIRDLVADLARFDLVVGARTGPNFQKGRVRSPLRTLFLLLCAYITGTRIPDPNSGLRAFRRKAIEPILGRLPRAFSFTTTMTLVLTLRGSFIAYHPIDYRKRLGFRKIRLVRDSLRVLQTLLEIVLDFNPLKAFLLLGVIPLLLALLVAPQNYSRDAVVTLVCTSFVIFALGMSAYAARNAAPEKAPPRLPDDVPPAPTPTSAPRPPAT